MKKKTSKFFQYVKEYRWSNVWAMIKNSMAEPALCDDDFRGRLVVITGATSGIGRITARTYASRGANLLCINRNREKSENLRRDMEGTYGVSCDYILADLSDMRQVKRAAEQLSQMKEPIDVLIHNAGPYLTKREVTPEGIEKIFMVHYLAPFIITCLLRDKLNSQKHARIILVSSEGHRFAAWGLHLDDLNWERHRYSGLKSYGSAKTAQLLTMMIFAEQFAGTGVTINAMHPGAVKTGTGQENGPLYRWFKKHLFDRGLKSPEVSAEALYYLGVAPDMEGVSGKFFNLTIEEEPAPPARDMETARELWGKSLDLAGLPQS
ncbi:SDR family NAD(P)-dependent oxidoreductase [bacterium]|nr:SDR family NAD(P)-dependent oxidoreductase [bacterium]